MSSLETLDLVDERLDLVGAEELAEPVVLLLQGFPDLARLCGVLVAELLHEVERIGAVEHDRLVACEAVEHRLDVRVAMDAGPLPPRRLHLATIATSQRQPVDRRGVVAGGLVVDQLEVERDAELTSE